MKAATTWRAISDRLPEKCGYYLCWTAGSRSGERPIIAWFAPNWRRFETKKPVTHWAGVNGPTSLSTDSRGQGTDDNTGQEP